MEEILGSKRNSQRKLQPKDEKGYNGLMYTPKSNICMPNMGVYGKSQKQNFVLPTRDGEKHSKTKENTKNKKYRYPHKN